MRMISSLDSMYLTAFADDINAYAASQRYAQGQATAVPLFCMLVGQEIAPSKNGGQRMLHGQKRI